MANCATPLLANKCLCATCKEDYFLNEAQTACTVCPEVVYCAADGMNVDSCKGCDKCKSGYQLATDKKACTLASWARRDVGGGHGVHCCALCLL